MGAKSSSRTYRGVFRCTGRSNFSFPDVTLMPVNATQTYTSTRSDGGGYKNWKERIKKGQDCTTLVQGTHISLVDRRPSKGWYTRYQRDENNVLQGPVKVSYDGYTQPTRPVPAPVVLTIQRLDAEARATKKFYSKLASINQDMQGLVFLGELKQTLRMLRNPAEAFMKAARNDYLNVLKRHKKRHKGQRWSESHPKAWADAVTGSWLEFQFGVQPLISDLKGAYDALDRLNWDPVVRKLIHAVGRDHQPDGTPSVGVWGTSYNLSFTSEVWKTMRKKVVFRALWERNRDAPEDLTTGKRLAESFGINMNEFVPTLWELMPWSFLLDYFTNIGDILEQSFASTSDIRWVARTIIHDHEAFYTSKVDEKAIIYNNSGGQYPNKVIAFDPKPREAFSHYRRRSFTREPWRIPNASKFMWEVPGSPLKYGNMTALLGQFSTDLFPQRVSKKRL